MPRQETHRQEGGQQRAHLEPTVAVAVAAASLVGAPVLQQYKGSRRPHAGQQSWPETTGERRPQRRRSRHRPALPGLRQRPAATRLRFQHPLKSLLEAQAAHHSLRSVFSATAP